jgi:hypothetical protein
VSVLGIFVGFEQVGRVEPGLDLLDAALQADGVKTIRSCKGNKSIAECHP